MKKRSDSRRLCPPRGTANGRRKTSKLANLLRVDVCLRPDDRNGFPRSIPNAPAPSALAVLVFASLAEWLHARRIRAVGRLAFGPGGAPNRWTRVVPFLRALCLSAFAWGLATLMVLKLGGADSDEKDDGAKEATRLVFVADLSPSMYLMDAGPDGKQTRQARMREVVEGILQRVSGNLRFGVIGFYTESLPVVMEARDPELVRNVFNGLPLTYAMPLGQTDLGQAINAAIKLVSEFPDGSTRLIIFTDGDSREPRADHVAAEIGEGGFRPRPRQSAQGQLHRRASVAAGSGHAADGGDGAHGHLHGCE